MDETKKVLQLFDNLGLYMSMEDYQEFCKQVIEKAQSRLDCVTKEIDAE